MRPIIYNYIIKKLRKINEFTVIGETNLKPILKINHVIGETNLKPILKMHQKMFFFSFYIHPTDTLVVSRVSLPLLQKNCF